MDETSSQMSLSDPRQETAYANGYSYPDEITLC